MTNIKSATEKHYYRENLYEDILNRLTELDVDLNKVTRQDLAPVDEFHVRGAQVSQELAEKAGISGGKLVDIGCGIGGPSRMLADEYECEVTGVDLSQEFIRTATLLSELLGLSEKTKFVCASAIDLPLKNNSYNVAWTQHVQMNVENKQKFYSEIERVLIPNGKFIYYDIFKKGDQKLAYPMPWANEEKISFLDTTQNMDEILTKLKFKKVYSNDETAEGIIFFENLIAKIGKNGPPKLGLNVLMGGTTKTKIINLLTGLKEGSLELQSGVYVKSSF